MTKNLSRWIPAVAVPAVIVVAGAVVIPMSANAAPNLPTKSAEQVLALLAGCDEDSFSGTFDVTSDLGLPSIDTGASENNLDLLTGSHEARVYVDGSDRARVQVLDNLAERDVIRNGDDVWLYSSDENTVVHATAASAEERDVQDPTALAEKLVAALEPSSILTVTTAQTVAGRDAYTLLLAPKSTETLIGSISIAVDAETGLALSVGATARGENDPAWQVAFSSLDLATPSADIFDFSPSADATVKEQKAPSKPEGEAPDHEVTGTGWESVVSVTVGSDLASSPELRQLSTAVDGGRLIHTALVNVLVTDDGKVLAGSVPAATLAAAAE